MNLHLPRLAIFVGLLATTCLINLPLGYLRSRVGRFSGMWFLYVHLSIPVIYLMRTHTGFGYWAIPPLVAAALLGQIVGGRLR